MRSVRRLQVPAILSLMAVMALSSAGQADGATTGAAASPAARSADATDKVIVVLRDQAASLPDTAADARMRTADVAALQDNVLAQLAQTHARDVHRITLINAVAATVSPAESARLAASPDVAEVIPDLPVQLAPAPLAVTQPEAASQPAAGSLRPLPGACAPDGQVQLDPEALDVIHAASAGGDSAQALGYTGAGVKVAILADGIDPDNPDFIRPNGSHVIVGDKDFTGGGTSASTYGGEAFQDAASIAAQGRVVYNLAAFGPHKLSVPCRIRILGVAPGADVVDLEVANKAATAISEILEAIDYAVTSEHVNIINESVGVNSFPDTASLDVMDLANEAAVRAGVTVTVATGDSGPTDTMDTPAADPMVISVGASTTFRAYAQAGVMPPEAKGWLDNNISAFSSSGVEQDGGTIDVVAPGDTNWAPCTPDPAKYSACTNLLGTKTAPVEYANGTSESAPLVAGVAALVIQAYRESHHGQTPSPAVIKQIVVGTAQDINAPADQQGAGMVDAYQAVVAAASYPGTAVAPAGPAVLESATQLNAIGPAGTSRRFTERVTNAGSSGVTLSLSSRTLAPYRSVLTRSLTLTRARAPQQLWIEAANLTSTVRFRVGPGQARLNASVVAPGLAVIFLIAPDGDLAAFNNPVDPDANYANVQVSNPAPGEWTALLGTVSTASSVPAQFGASTATWQRFGNLSTHSVALAPGASRTVTLTVSTPSSPGDQVGSIVVRSSASAPAFTRVTSVPVTLRTLLPAPDPSESFTASLTGGHPGGPDLGQTLYYQMDVPAGLRVLNASIGTASADNTFFAELINPSGQAVSTAANGLSGATVKGVTAIVPETGAQLHVLTPRAGRWWLAVDFYGTVSGTALAQPISITLNDSPAQASVSGLPDSPGITLAAGSPETVQLRVTDTGAAPEAYFADARLAAQAKVTLATQTVRALTAPTYSTTLPTYLVPSHTTAITATASSRRPLYFDLSWPFGDPDLISEQGTTATRTYAAPAVPDGDWIITPFLGGPFDGKAPATVRAVVSMTAETEAFDPSVSSPTGDLWLASLNPAAEVTPYVVDPGQSVTIPVTITPAGPPGTVVRGTLYLDGTSLITGVATDLLYSGNYPEASDLAAFSYSYTVG
ncbi:MAG TPA: S8 family serine peptidase [Streptosporangiaceae bacterium]|nr:S8 family serine peptidase [Streptosporangiaceae bacterium]